MSTPRGICQACFGPIVDEILHVVITRNREDCETRVDVFVCGGECLRKVANALVLPAAVQATEDRPTTHTPSTLPS